MTSADDGTLKIWDAESGTAFSPTDISAIKPWAKLVMITEAVAAARPEVSYQACRISISPFPSGRCGSANPMRQVRVAVAGQLRRIKPLMVR